MKYSRPGNVFLSILFGAFVLVAYGCGGQNVNVQELLNRPIEETGHFHQSKKYIKNGMTVVYLTGTPYDIGFAHGNLLKNEIMDANQYCWDAYDKLKNTPDGKWLPLSRSLERYIPEEYIAEMKGIADGAGIEYEKILFLNTLATISEHSKCFAFSFRQTESNIITVRQIDISNRIPLWKKMILYIIKPQTGYAFAALLNPGWVSGETGMNEKGITVSENNITIQQTRWDVMPIDQLSRKLLQYSKSIDDVEIILCKQKAYPARLIFASSQKTASIFEFANKEIASINMINGYLAMANHACELSSKNITTSSTKRLNFANQFLKENLKDMDIKKAIDLVRTSRITWRWNPLINNRQSIIFSPSTLDFWIAIPPESDYIPASYGPYVGFNLLQELYGTGHEPNPKSFPAY
jgi:Acyl-coenzyme A:6-aminopenicillanic acid acyl-transferase